jgi:type I restriction enzyme S subunit
MEGVWPDALELEERTKTEVEVGYTRFEEGDLLVPKISPTFGHGRSSIARDLLDGVGAGTTEFHVLRPKPGVEARWLFYVTKSAPFLQEGESTQYGVAGQKRISLDWLRNYPVPALSPEGQRLIVEFLDTETGRIDELTAEQVRLASLLEERLTTTRRQLLGASADGGWTTGALKRFVRVSRGRFTHRPRNDPALYDGPFPFIQTGDIAGAENGVVKTWTQTLNERGLMASRMAPAGTLVMAIAANIGDIAELGFDACFPDSVVALTPSGNITSDYLLQLMRAVKEELVGDATLNTQLNTNVERIGDLSVSIPPREEQEQLTAILAGEEARARSVREELQHQESLLHEHRQALITAAVTGGIEAVGRAA